MAAIAGIDPIAYLHADDVELQALDEIIRQVGEVQDKRRFQEITNIGVSVANALVRAFKR